MVTPLRIEERDELSDSDLLARTYQWPIVLDPVISGLPSQNERIDKSTGLLVPGHALRPQVRRLRPHPVPQQRRLTLHRWRVMRRLRTRPRTRRLLAVLGANKPHRSCRARRALFADRLVAMLVVVLAALRRGREISGTHERLRTLTFVLGLHFGRGNDGAAKGNCVALSSG